jgi:hypothetical protein
MYYSTNLNGLLATEPNDLVNIYNNLNDTNANNNSYSLITGDNTITNDTPYGKLTFSPMVTLIIAIIASTMSFVTIVGNTLVITAFIIDKNLRKYSNYFILNLSIADLLIGLLIPPYAPFLLYNYKWRMGRVACTVWLILDYVVGSASVLCIVVISLDRYLLVSGGLSYVANQNVKRAIFIMVTVWVIAFLNYAPAIIFWEIISGVRTVKDDECQVEFHNNLAYLTATACIEFFAPLVMICGLNLAVYLNIRKRSRGLIRSENPMFNLPQQTTIETKTQVPPPTSTTNTQSIVNKTSTQPSELLTIATSTELEPKTAELTINRVSSKQRLNLSFKSFNRQKKNSSLDIAAMTADGNTNNGRASDGALMTKNKKKHETIMMKMKKKSAMSGGDSDSSNSYSSFINHDVTSSTMSNENNNKKKNREKDDDSYDDDNDDDDDYDDVCDRKSKTNRTPLTNQHQHLNKEKETIQLLILSQNKSSELEDVSKITTDITKIDSSNDITTIKQPVQVTSRPPDRMKSSTYDKNGRISNQKGTSRALTKDKKAARSLFILVFVFVCCWVI